MGNIYREVAGAEELKDMVGCEITSISDVGTYGEDVLCINGKDKGGNSVSLVVTERTWHFLNEGEKQNPFNLTRDEILNMKPGPKLNLYVATDVIGHVDDVPEFEIQDYSGDNSHAIQLLQNFYKSGCEVEIHGSPDYGYYTTIKQYDGSEIASVCYPTLAESICKSALLAVSGL